MIEEGLPVSHTTHHPAQQSTTMVMVGSDRSMMSSQIFVRQSQQSRVGVKKKNDHSYLITLGVGLIGRSLLLWNWYREQMALFCVLHSLRYPHTYLLCAYANLHTRSPIYMSVLRELKKFSTSYFIQQLHPQNKHRTRARKEP